MSYLLIGHDSLIMGEYVKVHFAKCGMQNVASFTVQCLNLLAFGLFTKFLQHTMLGCGVVF